MKFVCFLFILILLLFFYKRKEPFSFFDKDQLKLDIFYNYPFPTKSIKPTILKQNKIAIITVENRNENYIKYHHINFEKYCKIHNYTYKIDSCGYDIPTYWCKIHKVKEYLPYYDYVMWADSDTIIPDISKSLDTILSETGEPDIFIGKDNITNSNQKILNSGLFIIKNSEIGRQFLDDCLSTIEKKDHCIINKKEQGTWAGICYEQGIMNLLIREKYHPFTFIDSDNDYFLNALRHNKTINYFIPFLHLAGYPNDQRENLFRNFI